MLIILRFFQSGKYIADIALQQEIFGPPLSVEEALTQLLREVGML